MVKLTEITVVVEQSQKQDVFKMLMSQGWYWSYYSVKPVGDDLKLMIGVWADD